jgi:hypothetical protein
VAAVTCQRAGQAAAARKVLRQALQHHAVAPAKVCFVLLTTASVCVMDHVERCGAGQCTLCCGRDCSSVAHAACKRARRALQRRAVALAKCDAAALPRQCVVVL